MEFKLNIGILGAGLGSRMQSISKSKPLTMLSGKPLLAHLIERFYKLEPESIHCALRKDQIAEKERAVLPQGPKYIFVNTESSLHTLKELILSMRNEGSTLFSMADTVLLQKDLLDFARFCRSLGPNKCAVLVTPHVDDEKPLWVQVDSAGYVTKFGTEKGSFVTSGMYFLSKDGMEMALECTENGMEKMRNFLAHLIERNVPVKTFVVPKTIDVDHPSDLKKAEIFLHSN